MDFRQLNYVKAVAEYGNITKAAAALYISQPSLSHYISKTEEELGVKLFDRSTTPLTLTYAGERYLNTARQILSLSEFLTNEMHDIADSSTGRIRVGIPRERSSYMLPLILPLFYEKYEGVHIEVVESGTRTLEDALRQGSLDIIITPSHVDSEGLTIEHIYGEELLLAAQKGKLSDKHFFKGTRHVDLDKIRDMPIFMLRSGRGIRTALDLVFKSYDYTPNIAMEVNSNMTAYRLAAFGTGVAVVPSMTVKLSGSELSVDVFSFTPEPVKWDIVAVYRKDAYISSAARVFLDIARQVFTGTMP
ncbi:MAG: LysR family transcriptional regulator [Clostridiales bacterium]|nr:LysR family transcriptional regulator [Clostridiales bacterium]